MSLQTITPGMSVALGLARDYGVIVADVWPGGPAEAAGLKVGDILTSVDGQPADNLPTVNYYFRLRDSTDPVQLGVMRGGGDLKLSMASVEQRSEFDSLSAQADPEKSLVPELGILGVEIDARIAAAATGLRDPQGIIVVARAAGPGSEVPLQPRDVIRAMNRKPMTTLQGLRDALRAVTPGSPVTLQIQREGRLMFVSFTLE
jgi:serine protease Do